MLPGETQNPEMLSFLLKCCMLFCHRHTKHIQISLGHI